MFEDDSLYNVLNTSTITDLLDSFGSGKALFNGRVIPETFTGDNSINFYRVGATDGGLDYGDFLYSINCRSDVEVGSIEIFEAVYSVINRLNSGSGVYFKCDVLGTLPPADENDNFNTPIDVRIKSRSN